MIKTHNLRNWKIYLEIGGLFLACEGDMILMESFNGDVCMFLSLYFWFSWLKGFHNVFSGVRCRNSQPGMKQSC